MLTMARYNELLEQNETLLRRTKDLTVERDTLKARVEYLDGRLLLARTCLALALKEESECEQ